MEQIKAQLAQAYAQEFLEVRSLPISPSPVVPLLMVGYRICVVGLIMLANCWIIVIPDFAYGTLLEGEQIFVCGLFCCCN